MRMAGAPILIGVRHERILAQSTGVIAGRGALPLGISLTREPDIPEPTGYLEI